MYASQRAANSPIPARKLWAPSWLVERVGLDFFDDVIACGKKGGSAGGVLHHIGKLTRLEYLDLQGSDFSEGELAHLEGLSRLQTLNLSRSSLTDVGMVHLRDLTGLQNLILLETKVSDAGLCHIGGMIHLQKLHLGGTNAGDLAMAQLGRMPKLEYLSLIGTRVGDAGLVHLSSLTNLKTIYLDDSPSQETNVTDTGVNQLKGLNSLRVLTFGRKVSSDGVESLRKALPKASIITFRR